ncbi:hypothetical protein ALQ85_03646 [Pseudomonas syringae]|nr:hypothetical protein ALQ85_03646 [Pseudomonas syringae]
MAILRNGEVMQQKPWNIPAAPVAAPAPPPSNPTPSTYEVASGVAKWAIARGLLAQLPADVDAQYLAQVAPIPLGNDAEQTLRHRGIESIAYNAVTRTIYLYTSRKVTQKELKSLPASVQRSGLSYPHGAVDVVGKGQLTSQGAPYALHSTSAGAHYACGSSISPGNDASAGTLGALVQLTDGLIYGLTNNHVSALCSHVQIDTPILAPGVMDVGPNGVAPFTLGFHTRALEMHHGSVGNIDIARNTDAAIFRINDVSQVTSMQGGAYDTPIQIADPVEGMRVEKVGRTTRHTKGQIVSKQLRPAGVGYQVQSHSFNSTIWFGSVFTIHGHGSEFSLNGDSGSLVVSVDDHGRPLAAVGLIFAGGSDSSAPGGAKSLMVPIRPILQALGATLVGGHNV